MKVQLFDPEWQLVRQAKPGNGVNIIVVNGLPAGVNILRTVRFFDKIVTIQQAPAKVPLNSWANKASKKGRIPNFHIAGREFGGTLPALLNS